MPLAAPTRRVIARCVLLGGFLALAASSLAYEGLESFRQAAEGVYVGGEPSGGTAWRQLAALGVRTVVGVDAPPPEAALAERFGLRVIHVPIGYGGIDPEEAGQLVRVARECERPLYVYCHHGLHRGPAAAAVVCRAAGLLDRRGATDLLTRAGTSPEYVGLWRDVEAFDPTTPAGDSLRASVAGSPLALAMSRLDRAWDTFLESADGEAREAALVVVREGLRESRRAAGPRPGSKLDAAFDSADTAFATLARSPDAMATRERFAASCVSCHERHRD